MGLGDGKYSNGSKKSRFNYEFRHLDGLQQSLTLLAGLATEATLQLVLSAIQDGQDFEAKLVEDTNGTTFLEVRIWNPDTQTWEAPLYYIPGSNTPYNVGDPGGPVAPITYINNGAILSQIYAELLDQGITLDNIETNTNDVSTETTLSSLLTAFNAEDFASETTLNSLLVAFNAEDFSTETTLASLLTAFNGEDFATEATLNAINLKLQDTTTGLAQEVTLAALLTAFNAEDFATETTLALIQALLTTIDADTSNLDVALSTRASEATLLAAATDINDIEVLLTPAVRTHNTITATVAGSVPAGSISGSVFNSGNQPAGWNGTIIPAGVSIPWGPVGNRDTYGAISYDPTISGPGTTLIIEYTT